MQSRKKLQARTRNKKRICRASCQLINNAKNLLFFSGRGDFRTNRRRIQKFIEKINVPAAATVMGLSALPTDHKLHVGMLGMHTGITLQM